MFSRQYFNESQCIFAIRRPGNVNNEPKTPQARAIKNLTTIFEAGPLETKKSKYESKFGK